MTGNILWEMLFPKRCPMCDGTIDPRYGKICLSCKKDVTYTKGALCMICGKPLLDESNELCPYCKEHAHAFIQARGAFVYKGSVRDSMYRFKYANRRKYARVYAECFYEINRRWLMHIEPDVIVPIPLYRKRQRQRGYNQAAVFAKALEKISGIPVREDILFRVKETVPQKKLDNAQRKKNLKDAFCLSDNVPFYRKVLLADDILTTGATFDEAAELFCTMGSEVYAACVCVGDIQNT